MSASPAGASSVTPNANPPNVVRRRPKTNPLVAPKKPARKVPQAGLAAPRMNGVVHSPRPSMAQPTPPPSTVSSNSHPQPPPQNDNYTDFPLITTKRSILQGLRHHVMRLASSKPVDITSQEAWTRPVRLHRRDPGAAPGAKEDGEDAGEDDKERERERAAKEERKRIREDNLKQIAPSAKKAKQSAFHKKAEQVFVADDSPEAQKRSQLRYEEALPWHLEDDDNKNTWVGTYEAPMSECHVMLMLEERDWERQVDGQAEPYRQGVFRMVPLEKWYKFTQTNKFRALTIDEAEAWMKQKAKDPRFLTEAQRTLEQKRLEEMARTKGNKLFMRNAGRGDEEKAKTKKNPDALVEGHGDAADADDIDFEHDELFQDDEEGPMFEGIEPDTAKDAEQRIKKEQRGANIFNLNDEKDVDEEAEREKKIKELQKTLEKGTRKALVKRERNFDYETGSDSDPYSTSSESDLSDSEAEKEKDEEGKSAEENKQGKDKAKDGDKQPSGTSSMGTNTPLANTSLPRNKLPDTTRKSSSLHSLKRPGSPDLSEASDNESSRKKSKSKHNPSTQGLDATSSRPMSPAPDSGRNLFTPTGQQPQNRKAAKHSAASGSDSEATDSGRHKRQKLMIKTSPTGTPGGSPGASRAGSPTVPGGPAPRKPSALPFPTADEVIEKVPSEGIAMLDLIAAFRGRVSGENRHAFLELVKRTLKFEKETKVFFRRPATGGAGGAAAGGV